MEIKKITKKTVVTGITLLLATAGMTGEFYLNKDITLLDQKYTGYEYSQIKKEIANWGEKYNPEKEKKEKTIQEQMNIQRIYEDCLEIEIKKCNNKVYPFSSNQDIRSMLKKYHTEGCPKL